MKTRKIFLVISFLFFLHTLQAQPFIGEIRQFQKEDSLQQPTKNSILFIGSSSFTKWKDVQQYFPEYKIVNRGFGGSSLPHLIYYFDDIVKPYRPSQVVIYCGENDLTDSSVTSQIVYYRFLQLFSMLRQNDPELPVVFVSLKPSPSRLSLMPKMEAANHLIENFLNTQTNAQFVDVYHDMLKNGRPDPAIFLSDSLHMNAKGYAIWQKKLKPFLKN